MGPEEGPRLVGPLVGLLTPDVAAPDHPGTGLGERRGHARRLGVVQEHHIALPDAAQRAVEVRRRDVVIVGGLLRTQLPGVTGGAVQAIVDPLGDGVELGIAGHHEPADVDIDVLDVADQHVEHLGDPTAGGRRAEVPDGPPVEPLVGEGAGPLELLVAILPDEGF
jgi:hypothetical protein